MVYGLCHTLFAVVCCGCGSADGVLESDGCGSADGVLGSNGCDDCSVNSDGSETVCCSSTSSLLLFCLLLSYFISKAVL